MNVLPTLVQLGFDPGRLSFTLRTAVAVFLAVLLAWLAGLEHPQWSGMTVWAASLPVRGHLLEKSGFRAVGTVIGALFGMGLLMASAGQPWIVVIGLALWIGFCAGVGNVVRGFASYGAMLAGYSAAIVALLHSAHSADPLAVGIDRMLTVLLGLLVALAVGWIFASRGDSDDPMLRVQALSSRILGDLADYLAGGDGLDREEHHALLSEMAVIEERLDQYVAGSLRSREIGKILHRLLMAHVAVILWMRRGLRPVGNPAVVDALVEARNALKEPDGLASACATLQRAAGLTQDKALREALSALAAAHGHVIGNRQTAEDGGALLAFHRDWVGAREALFRATFVILAVGAVWLLSGWEGGPFMLLGTAIMMTIFSTADNPVVTLRQMLLGHPVGVAGALLCRWLVWPLAHSELELVLWMAPFVLAGGVLFGHRRGSGPLGYDYNMIFLLLLQPVWPLTGSFEHSLTIGAAIILGPAVGLVAFLLIFPLAGGRRLKTLMAMMVHEIEAMASKRGASRQRAIWRVRLYHRILRLVRWADKTGMCRGEAVDDGLALLLAGSSVLHIDELLQAPGLTPQTARRLNIALGRLSRLGSDPQRAARALVATAGHLSDMAGADAGLLREAGVELSNRGRFIGRVSV